MSKELNEYNERWFIKAGHDLISARTILEYEPLVLDVVCFHCQQAVEKYFKAFLIFNGEENTKTHDLVDLQNKCSAIEKDFATIDLKELTKFAVDVRYPDDFLMPELSDAKEYLLIAEKVKQVVKDKIVF